MHPTGVVRKSYMNRRVAGRTVFAQEHSATSRKTSIFGNSAVRQFKSRLHGQLCRKNRVYTYIKYHKLNYKEPYLTFNSKLHYLSTTRNTKKFCIYLYQTTQAYAQKLFGTISRLHYKIVQVSAVEAGTVAVSSCSIIYDRVSL